MAIPMRTIPLTIREAIMLDAFLRRQGNNTLTSEIVSTIGNSVREGDPKLWVDRTDGEQLVEFLESGNDAPQECLLIATKLRRSFGMAHKYLSGCSDYTN